MFLLVDLMGFTCNSLVIQPYLVFQLPTKFFVTVEGFERNIRDARAESAVESLGQVLEIYSES